MAPDINNPGGVKNDPDEIRDGVVSDATRFPGGFIDERVTEAGAPVQIAGKFQVTNASFFQSFDVSPQDTDVRSIAFDSDGSRLFVADNFTDNFFQYRLSANFDTSTASIDATVGIPNAVSRPAGIAFNTDGTQMYVTGSGNGNIHQYDLSTGFDISTVSFDQTLDVSPQDSSPKGVAFSSDGSQLFHTGTSTDAVYEYSLSTDFDITTATFSQSFSVSSQDGFPSGLEFNSDGSKLYVIGQANLSVFQYRLSTAFDISTASFSDSFDVGSETTTPSGIAFEPGGSQLYVIDNGPDTVFQYTVGVIVEELP